MNTKLEWYKLKGKIFLRITIKDNFDEKTAIEVSENFRKELKSVSEGKVSIIWNCVDMTNYEPKARHIIQNIIKELKDKVKNNYIVTTNKLIGSGAKILSIFTAFDMKVINSESEIDE